MRSLILQDWPAPVTTEDPLIAKRVEFYQRFSPDVAERHWQRWLEQRAAIDREFDRTHPYWREHITRNDARDLQAVKAERRPHWDAAIKTAQATLNTLKIETGPKK